MLSMTQIATTKSKDTLKSDIISTITNYNTSHYKNLIVFLDIQN